MRIIGDIEHAKYKISVFRSGEKTIIQIEDGLLEQLYKFRDGEIVSDMETANAYVNQEFLEEVESVFATMYMSKSNNTKRLIEQLDIEFPTII